MYVLPDAVALPPLAAVAFPLPDPYPEAVAVPLPPVPVVGADPGAIID